MYYIYANESTVMLYINIADEVSIPTSFTAFGGGAKISKNEFRPISPLVIPTYNSKNILIAVKTDGTIERRTTGSSQFNSPIWASATYLRKKV